jgi:hypothetical protein
MNIEKVIESISVENIYNHVLHLEGVRHPITNPAGMAMAADYIGRQLYQAGARVSNSIFHLDGFDMPFKNVEGTINGGQSSEVLITSHYDTVRNSPGADDNASAVAAMLEAARVLAESGIKKAFRFVSFTLEEGNPVYEKRRIDLGVQLGMFDGLGRFSSARSRKVYQSHLSARTQARKSGQTGTESWSIGDREIEDIATSDEKKYFDEMRKSFDFDDDPTAWIGKKSLMGSSVWTDSAASEERAPTAVINLETIGYTSSMPFSQRYPPNFDIKSLPQHGVDLKLSIGNFIAIVSDDRSTPIGQSFFTQCAHALTDLPALFYAIPNNIEQIARGFPDALRSDHAPFWKAGYPAIMITNTADFRTPYYHTPGDTIDKLDFDFIRKVCQATVMTAMDLG